MILWFFAGQREVRKMLIGEKETLLITGDSVTDCERMYPVGEGDGNLGNGYSRNVQALLDMNYPQRKIRVLNTGISGNTSRDLRNRWQQDVMDLTPDWVSIMIGINDIWRKFDQCLHPEMSVSLEEYESNLCWMLETTLPKVKGICLMPPCYMEQNHQDPMRAMADQYRAKTEELARKYGVLYADAQAAMDAYFQHYPPIYMAWDRVHPNQVGHMIIAKTLVDALGFQWNV